MASTNEELMERLALTYETSASIPSGGSPYGFRTTVLSTAQSYEASGEVLVSEHFRGSSDSDWLLATGLDLGALRLEARKGKWVGPFSMRTKPGDSPSPHYLYYISVPISDKVADSVADGVEQLFNIV
eukprot:1089974-Prymnesium_polylepis.1